KIAEQSIKNIKRHGKLIIMKGLPASGKSTKAKELLLTGNYVRVNKDLIREMLHFNEFNFKREDMTRHASVALCKMFCEMGINVIVDDTNINPRTLSEYTSLPYEHELYEIDTDMNTC